ncbi:murein hydrolase activator EnvC [Caballeronia sp. NK8]|uniref:murein hydrolase activator EnvC family protein n=1 Tax=Caballeronia sp. NK8 TaxID=140098 RepID=UPI001CED5891|nr:peptidoglycan DD-metalloendopeptidase family protein [Caballeronia sp. NK8]
MMRQASSMPTSEFSQARMIKSPQSRHRMRATCLAVAFSLILGACASRTPTQRPAQPTPQTTALDVPSTPIGFYRATTGDTLASIAAAYGRDANAIADWNGLSANAALPPGQLLRVGPPSASLAVAGSPTQPTPNATPCRPDALAWPIKGPVLKRFGSDGTKSIIIGGNTGDTIRAAQSGRVVYVGNQIAGYGRLVILKHNSRSLTAYGHNQSILVKEGNDVSKGQPIAIMGDQSGGQASLLFELRLDRQPVDPLPYLFDCAS